ncbi:MAG TPA: AMP-binding protein [Solirubrobacteraceae bacterium]|nr:AMP-binding protein [Solirubrobacteraceae bacterium]
MLEALHDRDLAARTALAFPERSLTYGQLATVVAGLSRELEGCRRVAILAEPRIETCAAVVAALEAGVAAVPVNPRSGALELGHIVANARPDAVMAAAGSPLAPPLDGLRRVSVVLPGGGGAGDGPLASADPELPALWDPELPALIVYTSGTTGPPKGAVLPRRAIESNLDALAQVWEWTERDVVAHALPLFHVHGLVLGILGPLRRGGSAMHLGRFSAEAAAQALAGPATVLFGVPTMYRRLADACERAPELAEGLRRARLLVSGSAALPVIEHQRLQRLCGRRVLERYGLTETLMNTAVRLGSDSPPGTVGPPLPGIEVRVVDDDGAVLEALDDETIGELQVRGPNLFLGYLDAPQATAAAMRDGGWFSTGDIVTRTGRGEVRIVGRRATDLIKSGGYKIGAGEIEACLREHPAVEDAAVTGEPDPDLGERVIAWVVARAGASPRPEELIDHVAALLAPHKRPREVHLLNELPRNELGKVQKRRLTRTSPAARSS